MDTNSPYEQLTDEECVTMCMICVARGVAVPCYVEDRVKSLGIWKLIMGSTDGYRYENHS